MPTGGRSRLREKAIANLLQESTLEKAAAATGISLRTLQRWLSDPDFQSLYQGAKVALLERAMARLTTIAGRSVEVLGRILDDTETNAASKVSGVRVALDMCQRDREISQLEARIRRLEDQSAKSV